MADALSHEDLALLYHAGELEEPARGRFQEHWASCAECRRTLRELGLAQRLAGESTLQPPADAVEAVARAARPVETGGRVRLGLVGAWGWRFGLGLAFAATVFVSLRLSPAERPAAWRNTIDVELAELDQRMDRLNGSLSLDSWSVEFKAGCEELIRQQRELEDRSGKTGGA